MSLCISSEIVLFEKVTDLLGGLTCEPDTMASAAAQAYAEVGASPPVTDDCQCFWLVERTRRHVLYTYMIQYAKQFKCKTAFVQQKFEHFCKIIECADKHFAELVNSPTCPLPVPAAAIQKFMESGFLVAPAGYVYDQLGFELDQ